MSDTTVQLSDENYVIVDNVNAPPDMRNIEVGRVIDGGFQPAFLSPWCLRPETLRKIAVLVENVNNVHSHGPDAGLGLGCPERRMPSGKLRGSCIG